MRFYPLCAVFIAEGFCAIEVKAFALFLPVLFSNSCKTVQARVAVGN